MQTAYRAFEDYYENPAAVVTGSKSWSGLRLVTLTEMASEGEVRFTQINHSAMILTLDGTKSHITHMDGLRDDSPSQPGEICTIPQGVDVRLGGKNYPGGQHSVMIEFDPRLFALYLPEVMTDEFLRGHLKPTSYTKKKNLRGLFEMLMVESHLQEGEPRGRLYADATLHLLALEVASMWWSSGPKSIQRAVPFDRRVSRALDYIDAHFAQDISIRDIALAAGQSVTQLNVAFRKTLGETPYSRVIDRRLSHAAKLLRTTDLSIATIALESGFFDQAHLTRMCQAKLGKSPVRIRKD